MSEDSQQDEALLASLSAIEAFVAEKDAHIEQCASEIQNFENSSSDRIVAICDAFFDYVISIHNVEQLSEIYPQAQDFPPFQGYKKNGRGKCMPLFKINSVQEWYQRYIAGEMVEDIERSHNVARNVVALGIAFYIYNLNNAHVSINDLLQIAEVDKRIYDDLFDFLKKADHSTHPLAACECLCITPLALAITLLVIKATLCDWSLEIDWNLVEPYTLTYDEYQPMLTELDNIIAEHVKAVEDNMSIEISQISRARENLLNKGKTAQNEMISSKKLLTEVSHIVAGTKSQFAAFSAEAQNVRRIVFPDSMPRLTPMSEHAIAQEEREILQHTKTAQALSSLADAKTSVSRPVIKKDMHVLARKAPRDAEPFIMGKVSEVVTKHSKFRIHPDGSDCAFLVDLSDIAVAEPATETLPVGFRVVALVQNPKAGNQRQYLAGVVSNRLGSMHNFEYLIFFDTGFDEYVSPANVHLSADQPLHEDKIDSSLLPFYIIDNMARREFIGRYFKAYPDWSLVRLRKTAQNGRIVVRNRFGERCSALVMDVDRHMALLRFPTKSGGYSSANCAVRHCTAHYHEDERIYRGSERFEQIETIHKGKQNYDPQLKRSMVRRGGMMLESAVPKPSAVFELAASSILGFESKRKTTNTMRKTSAPIGVSIFTERQVESNKAIAQDRELEQRKKKSEQFAFKTMSMSSDDKICGWLNQETAEFHDACTAECAGVNPDLSKLKNISPFLIPIKCGWTRQLSQIKSRRNRKPLIMYRAPCGRTLRSMQEISAFLNETSSELTIDMFSFNKDLRENVYVEVDSSAIVLDDFTRGREAWPIPVVNTVDKAEIPNMTYSHQRFGENEEVNLATLRSDFCSGCSCTDDCQDPTKCACQILTRENAERLANEFRPPEGHRNYVNRMLGSRISSGIYECNNACSCSKKKCYNRVVQQPIKVPLQLFQTAGCGWGVRTLVDLPAGYFIANYTGAILTDTLADHLKDRGDEYFAELDLVDALEGQKNHAGIDLLEDKGMADLDHGVSDDDNTNDSDSNFSVASDGFASDDSLRPKKRTRNNTAAKNEGAEREEGNSNRAQSGVAAGFGDVWDMAKYFKDEYLFVIDAKKRGNIGRFLNHSCQPNVYVQHVFVDTHDLRLPWVSFFTSRAVSAGEELCWDYNYTIDESYPARIKCNCGTPVCRGRLL